MSARKKLSEDEVTRRLIADGDEPSAWNAPQVVPPSRSPRPAWYGRTKHLELAAKFYVLSVLHRLGAEASLTSERFKSYITRHKTTTVSLGQLASKLDATSAWEQFAASPAA